MPSQQIKLLRQQVAAAEFLLRNLKAQLQEAERNIPTDTITQNNSLEAPISDESRLNNSNSLWNTTQRSDDYGNDDDDANSSDEEDAPGDETDHHASEYDLPSIEKGTVYPSISDVKSAVLAHAISQGWTTGVSKRDRTRIVLRCRSAEDCPFHLRAEQHGDGARICAVKPEHSCDFQPDQSHILRSHASSVKFLRQELPTFMNVDEHTSAKEISDAIYERFGTRVSHKQCTRLKVGPKRKRTVSVSTCGICGGVGHNKKTCGRNEEMLQTLIQ